MLPISRSSVDMAPRVGGPINRLDSFFDRVFRDDGPLARAWSGVPMAVWEDDDHVYVEAELPGVRDEDVDITVHNGLLFIRGERKPAEGRKVLYDGRAYGRFERVLTLPEAVRTDDVQARLADGILAITLPKSPEARPRKIPLRAG